MCFILSSQSLVYLCTGLLIGRKELNLYFLHSDLLLMIYRVCVARVPRHCYCGSSYVHLYSNAATDAKSTGVSQPQAGALLTIIITPASVLFVLVVKLQLLRVVRSSALHQILIALGLPPTQTSLPLLG